MKNYEVGIIIVAVAIIGFLWWQNQGTDTPLNPVNSGSPGYPAYTSGPSWFGGPV
jgi:hypothetical protein